MFKFFVQKAKRYFLIEIPSLISERRFLRLDIAAWICPPKTSVDFPPWCKNINIQNTEIKIRTPVLSQIIFRIILLYLIDSIIPIVWEIHGSKVAKIVVYRDEIVQIVKLTPSYISNHQEYWIGYREKNYSELNNGWNKCSEIVFCMT